MSQFVWCKNEERRIPTFRCLLCRHGCYPGHRSDAGAQAVLEGLVKTGRFKERFVMKRRGTDVSVIPKEEPLPDADDFQQKEVAAAAPEEGWSGQGVFLIEEGRLQPFLPQHYTTSILYEAVESFQVESRFVRPEEPGNLIIEGKRPTKRTVPILIPKSGECVLLESWERLEAEPSQLAEVEEVIGAIPVKQVFVLKRK